VYQVGFNQVEAAWGDTYMTGANVLASIQGLAGINATDIRLDAPWELCVPARGVYVWDSVERAVALATDNGLNVLLMLSWPWPKWRGYTPTDYGDFCKAAAQHFGVDGFTYNGKQYGPVVTEYELWNEPNLSAFWPMPIRPTDFVPYLKAGYTAIKSVMPNNSTVVSGSLHCGVVNDFFGNNKEALAYVQGMYDAGVQGYFDVLGLHPYSEDTGFNQLPPTTDGQTFVRDAAIRSLMNSMGDSDKDIWWTEWGFATNIITEQQQTQYMQTQYQMWLDRVAAGGYGKAFVYNFRDSANNPHSKNDTLGIVHNDFTPKDSLNFWVKLNPGEVPVSFSGSGSLSAPGKILLPARFGGEGKLDADQSTVQHVSAGFTGEGTADAPIFGRPIADLYGAGKLSADAKGSQNVTAGFTGSGGLQASADPERHINPLFSGEGSSSATSAQQRFFSYTFTGSTKPTTLFTEFGGGYQVSGGVAANNPAIHTIGTYYAGAIYDFDHLSADHSSSVTRASGAANGQTSDIAIVRSDPTGNNWVGCTARWGGTDSVQILTCIGGVINEVAESTEKYSNAGSILTLVAEGDTYTVFIDGVETGAQWTDIDGVFPGASNTRSGFAFQYRWANAQYGAPGITAWSAQDNNSTIQTPVKSAAFTGSGALAGASAPVIPAPFSGSGAAAGLVDIVGGSHNAGFTGAGALSATGKESRAATAAFTGSGTTLADTVNASIAASLSGAGGMTALSFPAVQPLATGAGHRTSSSGAFTITASWSSPGPAVSDLNTVAVVAAETYRDTGGTSLGMSATYGGVSMTQAGIVITSNAIATALFYLINPPAGTQTVQVSSTGNALGYIVQGNSEVYGEVGSVGAAVTLNSTASSTPSLTVASAPGGMVVAAIDRAKNNASTTITVNGTQRYNAGGFDSQSVEYVVLSMQDMPGDTSVSIGASVGSGTSRGVALSLNPTVAVPTRDADFGSEGTLVAAGQGARQAAMSGDGALAATGVPSVVAAPTGSGALAATAKESRSASAGFTGSGSASASSSSATGTAAAFTGSGALAGSASEIVPVTGTVSGSGSLTAGATQSFSDSAPLTGAGTFAAVVGQKFPVTGSLSGSGTASATNKMSLSFTFSGSTKPAGIIDVIANASGNMSVSIVSGGTINNGNGPSGVAATLYAAALWPDPTITVLQDIKATAGSATQHTGGGSGAACAFDSAGTNGVVGVITDDTAGGEIVTKVGSTWTVRASNTSLRAVSGDVIEMQVSVSAGIYTYTLFKNGVTTGLSWTDSAAIITPGKFWGAAFRDVRSGGVEHNGFGVSTISGADL
jgi:hypothetical protein